MKRFNVKFFGSKNRKEQIKQVKMVVQTTSKGEVESVLRYKLGYKVINGLKIREVIDDEY